MVVEAFERVVWEGVVPLDNCQRRVGSELRDDLHEKLLVSRNIDNLAKKLNGQHVIRAAFKKGVDKLSDYFKG